MAKHPFNPIETLSTRLRDSKIRLQVADAACVPPAAVDEWANGIGSIEIASLPAVLALAGLEIARSDILSAMTVLAKYGMKAGWQE